MKKAIRDIAVGKRHRVNLGDIGALAASMKSLGLLQAIGVDKAGNLVFGGRRLAAATQIGWEQIECRVIDLENPLLAERDENLCREDFTPSEKVSIAQAIEESEKEKAAERLKANQSATKGGDGKFQEKTDAENFSASAPGRAKDKAAAAVGMSRPTYEKAKEVVQDGTPEDVQEMDQTGKVDPVHKKVRARKEKEAETNGQEAPDRGEAYEGVDALGHPITAPSQLAFDNLTRYEAIDSLVRNLQKQVHELSLLPGGEQLRRCLSATGSDGKTINKSEHLNALKRDLRFTRPHSVCPWCLGKATHGCKGCSGTGWVTKTTWDNAEDSIQRRLTK